MDVCSIYFIIVHKDLERDTVLFAIGTVILQARIGDVYVD